MQLFLTFEKTGGAKLCHSIKSLLGSVKTSSMQTEMKHFKRVKMFEPVNTSPKCTQTTSVTVRSVPERSVHCSECGTAQHL